MGEVERRMKLILFRHLWGAAGEWEDTFPRFKRTGYRGIESQMPPPEDRKRFRALLRKYGLEYIPQIFSRGKTVADHLNRS
jgi:sugar phosphate isomerase/epimerase